jgi:hypothetical protein
MATPRSKSRLAGGIWDKLGNRYESLWTVDALVRVLRGEIVELVVEPHGSEGQGVEFYTTSVDGTREYFSAKRQNTDNAWSLADLTRPNETGRSILRDLFERLSSAPAPCRAVFASGTSASKLTRLCDEARNAPDAKTFEEHVRGSADLTYEIESHLLKKFGLDWSNAWQRLQQLWVDDCGENTLLRFLERVIDRDLVQSDGQKVSPTAARLVLYELVFDSFGQPIRRNMIVDHLVQHQLAPRDWNQPGKDHDQIDRKNRLYTDGVEIALIQNVQVVRNETGNVLSAINGGAKTVVLTGSAGMGKSCVLAQCVRALQQQSIPCLALRLDAQISASTADALGHDIGLSLSPAVVLSGVARGRPSVLIIDQLDALSTASGRNPRLWDAFQDLLFEVDHLRTIQVILACRSYDLENDDRLRSLVEKKTQNPPIKLAPLEAEFVRSMLSAAGAPLEKFFPRHIEFLRTPLHLNVFLRGDPTTVEPASDLTMLYDSYWDSKIQRARTASLPVKFEDTVNRLAHAMSERQTLTAPKDVFDSGGLSADAASLASDHVLIFDSGRYRFFHETFFDYVFARHFVSGGGKIVPDLLTPSEQHLFRRGQVRQVLAYQRRRDGCFAEYLVNLRELLLSPKVRIHVKKAVIDWLKDLADPDVEEWTTVLGFREDPKIGWFARTLAWNKPAWYPVLEKAGTWDRWLSGGASYECDFAIRLLALPETIKIHSAGIAVLMRRHLQDTPEWRARLAALCDFGEIHHSREFFDLFLEKLHEGWFDQKPGRHWHLTALTKENPSYAGDLIAAYLRHRFPSCIGETDSNPNAPAGAFQLDSHFFKELENTDPLPVLQQLLPVLVSVLRSHASIEKEGRVVDPLGSHLLLDDAYQFGNVLIRYIIGAMRKCATDMPSELSGLTRELVTLPNETAAILLESVWPANGAFFASEAVAFLCRSPQRIGLEVYHNFGDQVLLAVPLIQAIRAHLSESDLYALETRILQFKDDWEQRKPNYSGQTQYKLLSAFSESGLTPAGWHRMDELRRKFGPLQQRNTSSRRFGFVGSPITFERAMKMGDQHWLNAMRKYSQDRSFHRGTNGEMIGGSIELGRVLEKVAQADKPRFADFLKSLPSDVNPTYFAHLLTGLCRTDAENDEERKKLPPSAFASLLLKYLVPCFERIDALPGRVSGKQICWNVKTISECPLPDSLLKMIAYYAEHDSDPQEEIWRPSAEGKTPMYSVDPHFHGMNATRGAAAETITQMLFADPSRLPRLETAITVLVSDKSLAVRSCAIGCLVFLLREHRDLAVQQFLKTVEGADEILDTHHVERFIHFAQFTHYSALRPLLLRMLALEDYKTRAIAARQITLAAFKQSEASHDLTKHVIGTDEISRAEAAGIFAHNLKEPEWAPKCREFLTVLFRDSSAKVQEQADNCWTNLEPEQLADERNLLDAFIESPSLARGVDGLLRKLEDCPLRLPDVVLRIPERLLQERMQLEESERGKMDFGFHSASKLVMTVYQQSRGHDRGPSAAAFQTRCLNIIDEMIPVDHGSMDTELRKLDEA